MRIALLGPLEVVDGSTPIEISGTRLRSLLTALALDAPRAISASVLVDILWRDDPPADEANALQSLVSRLRKALGDPGLIQGSPAGYRLDIAARDVDIHRFDELSRDGREALRRGDLAAARGLLTEALSLWRGYPVELAESGHHDALLARLDEAVLEARGDLIEAALALGPASVSVAELEGLVAAYPMRERFSVLLLRALHQAGRPSEALTSFERTKRVLADELGIDPSAELQAAHLAVLRDEPAQPPGASASDTNLRATLTSFVGRDEQLVQIGNLLAAGRLVTLVGPGGAGKTRLATSAAAAMAKEATDAVWLAELAPVTDPADVPQAVLGSLGLRDAILLERANAMTPRDATTRLIDALAQRSALLVLDNCEHLIDAAAHLADQLLSRCPQLRILATSREPLAIFGEALVVVPPLGQPEPGAEAKLALTFPAVQLFADRAADVHPGFEVDDSTVSSVIEIVRRLDGLPLAIELAAARLRSLPVAEIERRLSDRFRLLTGGSRTAMPRHRTLHAVVEWSWDLLSTPERVLAERLAVFSGGVTAAAAATVCCDADLKGDDVEDLLTSLVDKSLLHVVATVDGVPRYRMLETIREFGMERMAERDEVGRVRLAHAQHFAALVAEADPHLRRADQLEWMAMLAVERDNILAALKFFGDDGRAADAIDLVNLLGWYWMTTGNHNEIVTWVSFALAITGDVDPAQRLMAEAFLATNSLAWDAKGNHDEYEAGVKSMAGISERMAAEPPGAPPMMALLAPVVAMFVGDNDRAGPLADKALDHEDPWIAAAVRTFRASIAENEGDITAMRLDTEIALEAFRSLGERWGMANTLQVLGHLELMQGNLEAAAAAFREGLEMATALGGREDVAMMHLRLADILTRQGDGDGAQEHAELARIAAGHSGSAIEVLFTHVIEVEIARGRGDLEFARQLGDEATERLRALPPVHPIRTHGLAVLLSSTAKISLGRDEFATARERLDESYQLAVTTKDMPILATVGVAVAMFAARLGHLDEAAEILGAATQLRGADDATHLDIAHLDHQLGGVTDGPYSTHYANGKTLSREAAIARVDPATVRSKE